MYLRSHLASDRMRYLAGNPSHPRARCSRHRLGRHLVSAHARIIPTTSRAVSFVRNTDRLSKRHGATAKTNLKCLLSKQSELATAARTGWCASYSAKEEERWMMGEAAARKGRFASRVARARAYIGTERMREGEREWGWMGRLLCLGPRDSSAFDSALEPCHFDVFLFCVCLYMMHDPWVELECLEKSMNLSISSYVVEVSVYLPDCDSIYWY